MPADIAEEAPKKRRGRPPGKKAARKDPDDAPVNGDYERDVVFNKEEGKRYAWLSNNGQDADVPRFQHKGYVKTERREGGPRPAWDIGSPEESGFSVGGLTLYECDEEVAERYDQSSRKRSDRRLADIKAVARANGCL